MANSAENIDLPDQLQELEAATQAIAARAAVLEADINDTYVPFGAKYKLLAMAVKDLDRQANGVYFGEPVQIDGTYVYPRVESTEDDILITLAEEFGSRRVISRGFSGKVTRYAAEDGSLTPYDNLVRLTHLALRGNSTLSGPLINMTGTTDLEAPIGTSLLSLAVVEDYKQLVAAENSARKTEADAPWVDRMDEAMFEPAGPNLPKLGALLSRLRALYPERSDDHLSYVNRRVASAAAATTVLCRYFMDYDPDQPTPRLFFPEQVVTGEYLGICFTDDYLFNPRTGQTSLRLSDKPILSLSGSYGDSQSEHTMHIPLSAIQCAEFK